MTPTAGQRLAVILGLLAIVAGTGVGFYVAFSNGDSRHSTPGELHTLVTTTQPTPRKPVADVFFRGGRPDLVLVLSGDMHGFLMPCGCARPQTGGLERRFQLVQGLKARGWPLSLADLGDVAPPGESNAQNRIKYEISTQILHDLGYSAVGLGAHEASMPLKDAFDLALSFQPPFIVAANMRDQDGRFAGMYQAWTSHEPRPGLVIGYVGVVADSVQKRIKPNDPPLVFDPVEPALEKALAQLEERKPTLRVLLFQGTPGEAKRTAERFPQFHLVLTQGTDEPSALAQRMGSTLVVSTGHKGRYLGLAGLFLKDEGVAVQPDVKREPVSNWADFGGFEIAYQLVELGEAYQPANHAVNLARERLRDYVVRVHQELSPGETFLTRYPRGSHPLQLEFAEANFAGASACKECHPKAYKVWSGSRHSHAYESLIEYGKPFVKKDGMHIGRQFDPDCVKCHTTGFEYRGGFVDEKKTPLLKGNGCENCHGPSSLHVARPNDPRYSLPLRLSVATVEQKCRQCHDGDNDPKFDLKSYWPKIQHGRE